MIRITLHNPYIIREYNVVGSQAEILQRLCSGQLMNEGFIGPFTDADTKEIFTLSPKNWGEMRITEIKEKERIKSAEEKHNEEIIAEMRVKEVKE